MIPALVILHSFSGMGSPLYLLRSSWDTTA
jgi:hypothetical protein